ncbi:unnamed protein product [Rhizophagus irregularis]|uniref:Uncharacterized protein n=1 Tax=Rhizophagus irregularis TaxID=588596 RepID=A0A2I1E718_9GLOM|nr:hypothetical protein RhiirB3_430636 [Rhizophagus irregularis]CAB5363469.1 unnamed protein product [Rhizophagus irregularis]
MSNPKRTISSIINNAKSRDYFETKIGRSFDNNRIKFLSPRNNKGYCQAFDIKTCGLECRIKSYMTYPLCAKHDRPKFVAAIHAKEYLSSMPIYSSLSDEFINDLSTYFTERCLDLKRPIEEGMFYVMHRVDRISKHEEGFCRAVFAEGYVTPIHSDCRLVDGVIKKLLAASRVEFKCNCTTKHIEYYDVTALSVFERVENWICNNPTGPIAERIQNTMSLSHT